MAGLSRDARGFLDELINTPSPSGFEAEAQRAVRRRVESAVDRVETDVHGNLAAVRNPQGCPRVMLAGHCDEVGLMVRYINDEGFLYTTRIGGPNLAALLGQRVRVLGAAGAVSGVVGRKRAKPDEKLELKLEDFWIDIGAKDRKAAEKAVRPGDPIVVAAGMERIGKGLLTGRGFDDRAGVFVIAEVMRALADAELEAAVYGVSTCQEEVGSRGARTSAFGIAPDIGIAIDVNHATDHPDADRKALGEVKLGKGPVLLRGSNVNPAIGDLLVETARKEKIPVQLSGFGGPTPTDASVMQVTRAGVATALVKIPLRYMHTPSEILAEKDLEGAVRLLVAFLRRLGPGMDFRPV